MVESAVKRQILAIVNITMLVILYGVIRPYHQYTGVLHVVNRRLPHGDGLIDGDVVDLSKCFLKKAPKK